MALGGRAIGRSCDCIESIFFRSQVAAELALQVPEREGFSLNGVGHVGPEGRVRKPNKRVREPPLVDHEGSYSYSFDYIRDFCKVQLAASY